MPKTDHIRNFSIIAHIDHGKSTLADRMLMQTGNITERDFRNQVLDAMDLERERGITIKASAVRLDYVSPVTKKNYVLNLIDTPGHVDFHYEVSRSLAACEGALLLVDAAQGVEAQTVANAYLAVENRLEVIPVINKIDLPTARPDDIAMEIEQVLGFDAADCMLVSAKEGTGVPEIFEAIIEKIPSPVGDPDKPLRALVFDSEYNEYHGVIVYIRLIDGKIEKGQKIRLCQAERVFEIVEIGVFRPQMQPVNLLSAGEVGYFTAAIKDVKEVRVGDTVTGLKSDVEPLAGYKPAKPMVFCGFYPSSNQESEPLRKALERLSLNDPSFHFNPEFSQALGFGFRCGFLGMLHKEIIQERLEREFSVDIIQTAPNVTYEALLNNGEIVEIFSPADVPDPSKIKELREPIARTQFILPTDYIGGLMKLCEDRRGQFHRQEHLGGNRVIIEYDLPLAEIVFDFYDKLKSATRGYGTMDYEVREFRADNLVKVDIMVASAQVDALSMVCHRSVAERRGRSLLVKLRKEIPRHLFQIALQAAIGGKVIARENISAMAKNVTAKCYGGDISRKRKLLEKQKAGKKRMKNIGGVELSQEAFLSVLDARDDE
ncbi:MAG: translation elongation factor 4 [Planctomycetota bacterium]